MKRIDDKGCERIITNDIIDHFTNRCPVCGEKLGLKRIKKARNMHRRGLRSFICPSCGYAEYDSNEREEAITKGYLDE